MTTGVLDEPTSRLDPGTAERLIRDVLPVARDKSLLLITHRSDGLERIDRAVALEATGG